MSFFKNLFTSKNKNTLKERLFNMGKNSFKNLICGIGESEVLEDTIMITNYPFEPSIAYPSKRILIKDIDAICIEFGMIKIDIANDIVFVSAEHKELLKVFTKKHNIPLSEHRWNWDWILEPYLDTEFTEEIDKNITENLLKNGFSKHEIDKIRNEVGSQMYKYNFNTMLWEWCSLGLFDVLSAMRAKYDAETFRLFYKKAIEIDRRTS